MSLFFSILGHTTNKKRQSSNTLLEGLVAAWEMNEASGTTMTDSHTNGMDGAIYGAILDGAKYSFDGTDDYVEVPDNDLLTITDSMSISVWVNVTSVAAGYQSIARKVNEYWLTIYNNQLICRIYENGTATYVGAISTGALTTGLHHIVMTWNGSLSTVDNSGIRFYIDGSEITRSAQGSILSQTIANTTNPLLVGYSSSTSALGGTLSDLYIYSKIITTSEITELYNSGTPLAYSNITASTPTTPTTPEQPSGEETFLASADFYVSSSTGNDTNDGLTPETAWATLNKVQTSSFSAGQVVALKAGDEWNESLTIPSSGTVGNPVTYSAYGTGAKPKIYGSDLVETTWTLHSGNIYKTTIDKPITQLFANGVRKRLARYEATGEFSISNTVNSTTQFQSNDLSTGMDYTGATCLYKGLAYVISTRTVTASSSNTITLSSAPNGGLGTTKGFVLLNKLAFLTQAGEWYYDDVTNTLYFWTDNGDSPDNYEVRVSVRDTGIYHWSKSYVTIANLNILQCAEEGIWGNNSNNITYNNCKFDYNELEGIRVTDGSQNTYTVTNCEVNKSNGNGIRVLAPYSTIEDNTVNDICELEELGVKGTLLSDGIYFGGTDVSCRYNKVNNVAYNGIHWLAPNATIQYNKIDGANILLDDGGGIYTWSGDYLATGSAGSLVDHNIILNVVGTAYGYRTEKEYGYGIYMDQRIHDVDITNNTIYNVTGGILMNNENGNNSFTGNTLLQFGLGGQLGNPNATLTISGNIFATTNINFNGTWWIDKPQRMFRINTPTNVSMNNNTYHSPYNTTECFDSDANGYFETFSNWQAASGKDALSTFDGTALGVGEIEELFYNDTKVAKDFALTGSYRDLDGVAVISPLTLQPFTSKILIKE